jgi:hypothetical protein
MVDAAWLLFGGRERCDCEQRIIYIYANTNSTPLIKLIKLRAAGVGYLERQSRE